jgi:hypothetical protein
MLVSLLGADRVSSVRKRVPSTETILCPVWQVLTQANPAPRSAKGSKRLLKNGTQASFPGTRFRRRCAHLPHAMFVADLRL